jgi:hypothetical protein
MSRAKAEEPEEEIQGQDDPGALPPKQELALRAVIAHPTLKEAALAAGVSETTLWRYTRDEEFSRRLREARRQTMSQALLGLQGAAGDAVRTLVSIANDPAAGPWPRLTAARTILDLSLRAHEADEVRARLAELERFVLRRQEEDALDRAARDGEGKR